MDTGAVVKKKIIIIIIEVLYWKKVYKNQTIYLAEGDQVISSFF